MSTPTDLSSSIIRVRRIKSPDDRTVWVDESQETLNSANELDVTHLNIAKPGELYRVLHPERGGPWYNTIFTPQDLQRAKSSSGYVYVIEQEDWRHYLQAGRNEVARQEPWWERALNRIFENGVEFVDYTKEVDVSFRASQPHRDSDHVPTNVLDVQTHIPSQSDTFSSAITREVNSTSGPLEHRAQVVKGSV